MEVEAADAGGVGGNSTAVMVDVPAGVAEHEICVNESAVLSKALSKVLYAFFAYSSEVFRLHRRYLKTSCSSKPQTALLQMLGGGLVMTMTRQ